MEVDAPTTPEMDVVHDNVDAPADSAASTDDDHGDDHGSHDHLSDNRYIVIAAILALITAAEVVASYVDLGPVFIPLLLFMMGVKFFIVVSFFMHLRFDNRVFTWLFYTGLFLAVFVYVAALTTFRFFDS